MSKEKTAMKKLLRTFPVFLLILLACVVSAKADTIYLRDGRTIRGTLLGYTNGRFAVRVWPNRGNTPDANVRESRPGQQRIEEGEIMFFRPNEIERIEIDGRSLDELKYQTRSIDVALGQDWIDSGIDLRRGEHVQTTATGTILAGRSRITPDGLRSNDPNAPLPRAAEGLLIGAVGSEASSPIIELGSSREFVAERDGRLYLTVNRGAYSDARGSFSVQVRTERDLVALDDRGDDRYGRRRDNNSGPRRSRNPQPTDNQNRTPQEATFNLPATSRGLDTKIDVRTGDEITFTATGTIVAGRRIGQVGPEGGRISGFGAIIGMRPVPSAGPGALIGFIRQSDGQPGQPFLIGSQLTLTAPADGRLYIAINDDDFSDNSGSFSVRIKY